MPRRIVTVAGFCVGLALVIGGIRLAGTREGLGFALIGAGALSVILTIGLRA